MSDDRKKHGMMMPVCGRDQIRDHDAIFFGAVGAPDVPDHITLWGLRLANCRPFDQCANMRPTRILPGIISPLRHVSGPELDGVIVRENSEGKYAGVGGRVHQGHPKEVATDGSMVTRSGVDRIIRYRRMPDDMDIDCGDILDGVSVARKGREIFEAILRVASGERTTSEQLGYGRNEFVPWQIGATM